MTDQEMVEQWLSKNKPTVDESTEDEIYLREYQKIDWNGKITGTHTTKTAEKASAWYGKIQERNIKK